MSKQASEARDLEGGSLAGNSVRLVTGQLAANAGYFVGVLVLARALDPSAIAGAIGEWNYYILGSAIEVALLAAVAYYAWTWPKENPSATAA